MSACILFHAAMSYNYSTKVLLVLISFEQPSLAAFSTLTTIDLKKQLTENSWESKTAKFDDRWNYFTEISCKAKVK